MLAVVTVWVVDRIVPPPLASNPQEQQDFFLSNATQIKFDANGKIYSQIYARNVTHTITNNTFYFSSPYLRINDRQGHTWTIRAQQGKSSFGKQQIWLEGGVAISKINRQGQIDLEIAVESVQYYPKDKLVETNETLQIKDKHGWTTAQGARLDLKNGTIKLLANIESYYHLTEGVIQNFTNVAK